MNTPKTPSRTVSPTGLFWGQNGEISGADHAPYEGSDTWLWMRWEPLPIEAAEAFAQRGHGARCETCGQVAEVGG